MKKLLVLMLVLGMTSMASATITSTMDIQDDGGGMYSIHIANLNNVSDGLGGYWALVGDASNPLTGGAIAASIPALFGPTSSVLGDASGTGYFAAGIGVWGSFATTTPTYSTSPAVFADSFAWVDSAMYSGPEICLTLYTIDDYFNPPVFNSDYCIPEPMTIALLGLGGLFLLRRRK